MRMYVAGPYTKGNVEENVRQAILAGDELRKLGHTPYIPHLSHYWDKLRPHDLDFWYIFDLEWLEVCEGLLRLPGESVGADNEVHYARVMGIPVFYSLDEVREHGK